jgi:hypothetical protein
MQLGSGEILYYIIMNLLIIDHNKLLSLSSKILSISMTSNALLCRNLFDLFVLLFSNTWHLPMQLLSGKL